MLVFFTTIGFGALMPMVIKYFLKTENKSINNQNILSDEESEMDKFEKYSIQRYEVSSVSSVSSNASDGSK